MRPIQIEAYRLHVENGESLRAVARKLGLRNASTVLRWVRKVEAARDDPLMDSAIARRTDGRAEPAGFSTALRLLAERGAELLFAPMLEEVSIRRDERIVASFDLSVGEALAVRRWLRPVSIGRQVSVYVLTARATVPRGEAPIDAMVRTGYLSPELARQGTWFLEQSVVHDPGLTGILADLGPEMAELVERVCIRREGLMQAEQALGLPDRAGKAVLRLALLRIQRFRRGNAGNSNT